jgi:hypothetical protein
MIAPFKASSDELAKAGLDPDFEIPAGFVMDEESVPIVRGRNARGGASHDYFSCNDSIPVVSKQLAAAIYFEINEYCDAIDAGRSKYEMVRDWTRRWSKWSVVRVWPGYFHKRSVMATPIEIANLASDPYMTPEEKLAEAIVQSKEATAAIKDVPEEVLQKDTLVAASEKVTDDLKDAKADVVAKVEDTKP